MCLFTISLVIKHHTLLYLIHGGPRLLISGRFVILSKFWLQAHFEPTLNITKPGFRNVHLYGFCGHFSCVFSLKNPKILSLFTIFSAIKHHTLLYLIHGGPRLLISGRFVTPTKFWFQALFEPTLKHNEADFRNFHLYGFSGHSLCVFS